MSQVSIVIPVSGHASITQDCLETLFANVKGTDELEYEVIVVDDGSTDATPELLRSYGDRITVVSHERPDGFAKACNAGAAAASGDHLIFLNNDTVSELDWLTPLVRHARAHPEAAVIGSKLLYPNGTIQHAGVVICHDQVPRHIYRGFPADHPSVTRSRPFRAVTAACMLVRRSVFDELAGFDISFKNGFEDVDLCLRVSRLGHEVHYCHESVLIHREASTRAPDGVDELYGPNLEAFRQRWGSVTPDDLARYTEDALFIVDYSRMYPLFFHVSPLIGSTGVGSITDPFELLGIRSKQVLELLQENAVLRARLGDEDYARLIE